MFCIDMRIPKSIKCNKIHPLDRLSIVNENINAGGEFVINDELKNIFENEMHAYPITSDQSVAT
jgi:hypothetical protein